MSASNKKKLRKEQNTAALTEKQLKELQEAKKLKNYTMTFVIAMVLVVAIVIGVLLRVPIGTVINRNTHAITVGDHELNAVELNYFYADAVSDYYSTFVNDYGEQANIYAQWFHGINFALPMDDQVYDKETGETWGDHFVELAKKNAQNVYALYDLAIKEGHKITEDEQSDIDITLQTLETAAKYSGYSSADAYVRSIYGNGANSESYAKYYEMNVIATSYYTKYIQELEYTDKDYRDHEKDKYNNYTSYTYSSYTLGMSTYITGGTLDEDGKTTIYTDAEKDAARDKAKKDAEKLAAGKYSSVEDFNKAIAALEVNKDNKNATSSESKNILYTQISDAEIQKWVSDKNRKPNDITIVEAKAATTGEDGKEVTTVNGYYVVLFRGVRENTMPLANVRHILIQFDGGTKDSEGNVTYSDAEKAAAEKEARELLAEWKNGKKTEESFAELAKEKSEDSGTKNDGGLLEDITPDTGLVESFLNWCFDDRKKGDVDVIESEYGFHIMYYVGDDELTYRDMMIKSELVSEDAKEWLDEITKDVTVTDVNLSRVFYDYSPL